MKELVTCKLCGKEVKGLELHLTHCLKKHSITREMYDTLDMDSTLADGMEEIPEEPAKTEKKGITHKEVESNIFNVKQRDPDRPLSEALQEFDITEHEFISLLKQWKGEGNVPLEMRLKQKAKIGYETAEKFKDQEIAEVHTVESAETLEKEFGFKCIEVRSPKGTTPKTWVLKKL